MTKNLSGLGITTGRGAMLALLLPLLLWTGGCASQQAETEAFTQHLQAAQWALTLQLAPAALRPGEAAVCRVTLRNLAATGRSAELPSHESLRFFVRPAGGKDLQLIEPVYSEQEPASPAAEVAAGDTLERNFVLTTLALQRGTYDLVALYTNNQSSVGAEPERAYAAPVRFAVEGREVYQHRTVDGLLAHDDAVALARAHFKQPDGTAQGRWLRDDLGFRQWWVTLTPAGAEGTARACLIDPYLGRVRGETQPYQPEPAGTAAPGEDSKAVQQLKDQMGH